MPRNVFGLGPNRLLPSWRERTSHKLGPVCSFRAVRARQLVPSPQLAPRTVPSPSTDVNNTYPRQAPAYLVVVAFHNLNTRNTRSPLICRSNLESFHTENQSHRTSAPPLLTARPHNHDPRSPNSPSTALSGKPGPVWLPTTFELRYGRVPPRPQPPSQNGLRSGYPPRNGL